MSGAGTPGLVERQRRIGYVLSQFPCYDETFILREIRALAGRGVTLTIFSLRDLRQPVIQEEARPFLAATRYSPYLASRAVIGACLRAGLSQPLALGRILGLYLAGSWRRPKALLKSLALLPKTIRFAELARAERLDHLHAHWATFPASTALVISRLTGIPWSFTCHAHDIFRDPLLLPEKLAETEFALTCTANNKQHLESLSPHARDKVQVSYHGLDLATFAPDPARRPPAVPAILAVGSLLECKGFDLLIEACRRLAERGQELRLTIAGGGPEHARLSAQVARAGLGERVRFTGYVTQSDLVPLYRGADLFVLPAVLEIHWGIPNVLVEALACALPVVTTALPSLPELVEDGVHGLVARNRDPEDLAQKMAALLADPARRAAMGRAGRRKVEALFDIERTIDAVVAPLIEPRRSAPPFPAGAPVGSTPPGSARARH